MLFRLQQYKNLIVFRCDLAIFYILLWTSICKFADFTFMRTLDSVVSAVWSVVDTLVDDVRHDCIPTGTDGFSVQDNCLSKLYSDLS